VEESPARHIIGVGSGKGGVGKTTVAVNLALALRARGRAVGVVDADLNGPNLPLMLGITRHRWSEPWTLARKGGMAIEPVRRYGLEVVSTGFIIGEDEPMLAEGQILRMLVSQFLGQTRWSSLDYLIVDLPPGTGDVQQALLGQLRLGHALVVVTPQYVAHLDARKAVSMYRRAEVPVLGAVENMASLTCPHCGESIQVYPPVPTERSVWEMGVDRLGSVPLDPGFAAAADRGLPLLLERPESDQAAAFHGIAEEVDLRLAS
jgi:ATP-binding protein involved in chromosome partitioning